MNVHDIGWINAFSNTLAAILFAISDLKFITYHKCMYKSRLCVFLIYIDHTTVDRAFY